MNIKNKTVTVVGLGNSGVNAAILLKRVGAKVKATDSQNTPAVRSAAMMLKSKGIAVEIGGHSEGFIRKSDFVVVSPGVENSSPSVKWADEFKIPIISEMELGYRFCKGKIIAITGTNGKSTVTTLIGELLKKGGKDTVVAGNIGNSLCGEIARIKEGGWVVLEVSSFQLERIVEFKPHTALILNITDDHLDRYKSFDEYYNEKLKIFRNQDAADTLILNQDAKELKGIDEKARSKVLYYSRKIETNGAFVREAKIYCISQGKEREVCSIDDIRLKGLHNLENVLASILVGSLVGVPESSMRNTIKNFNGLPHRFETVRVLDGVEYIDDSKGTTVDSTYRALDSCEKPVILIAGGRDKNSDYSAIKNLIKEKVKYLILIGEAAEKIRKVLSDVAQTHEARTLSDAVYLTQNLAEPGTIVLLSPMCSSFDMFKDYKERGEVFKEAVKKLHNQLSNRVG